MYGSGKQICKHLTALLLLFFMVFSGNTMAQTETTDRISFTAHGGINFQNMSSGSGLPIMRSNLSRLTETSIALGAGIQYAITPTWTLETGYKYTGIEGNSGSFSTSMNTIVLKNIINLNQVFSLGDRIPGVNPFLSGGIGYDFYTVDTPSGNLSDNSASFNLGAGLAFKINSTIDFFTHYEYHIASNTIDNRKTGFNADLLNSLTAGIRFNLSRSSGQISHPSWEPEPVKLSHKEYSNLKASSRQVDHLQKRVETLSKSVAKKEQAEKGNRARNSKAVANLSQRLDRIKALTQQIQDSTKKSASEMGSYNSVLIQTGNFVQVFSSYRLGTVQKVRKRTVDLLKDQLPDAKEKVFMAQRGSFFQVLIGPFNTREKAAELKEAVSSKFVDSFTISFPRPSALQPAYKDLQKLNFNASK